ncbi:hypothetical protein Syun_016959 [Stephania yunnanensis]|uniref:Lipoyl-binding domain-containing protein n=1 Tax=Stephania yunnanensis TaxID=152371 RepID=A0AAP0J8D8_9MAGN
MERRIGEGGAHGEKGGETDIGGEKQEEEMGVDDKGELATPAPKSDLVKVVVRLGKDFGNEAHRPHLNEYRLYLERILAMKILDGISMNIADQSYKLFLIHWSFLDSDVHEHLVEVVFVELLETGASVSKGSSFGAVESVKATSDVNSPISGEVVEINTWLTEKPDTINSSPYEEGWMIKVKPSNPAELDSLLGPKEYEAVEAVIAYVVENYPVVTREGKVLESNVPWKLAYGAMVYVRKFIVSEAFTALPRAEPGEMETEFAHAGTGTGNSQRRGQEHGLRCL